MPRRTRQSYQLRIVDVFTQAMGQAPAKGESVELTLPGGPTVRLRIGAISAMNVGDEIVYDIELKYCRC